MKIKKENYEFLQFEKLKEYENKLFHIYTLGLEKNYRIKENYKNLCEINNLNYLNVAKANQAHTDIIKVVDEPNINYEENMDGLITNKKDIILATTNADCILLLFYDPVKNVIANTHSGWRGTLQEISLKTINKMEQEYGCEAKDIIVCMCPSIRKCHFEVDKDVYEMFYKKFKNLSNIEEIIEKKENKWNIDTVLINKTILINAGIKEENIEDCGLCSVCNKEKIHSYRAKGEGYGLATAIISLK